MAPVKHKTNWLHSGHWLLHLLLPEADSWYRAPAVKGRSAIILTSVTLMLGLTTMSTPEFDIIFRGDIVFGHQLAEVKVRLQHLFKVDAAKVDSLFTGRPVPLKRKLDEATANKYRDVLLKAGAQVEVCASANSPANAASKPMPVRQGTVASPSGNPSSPPANSPWTLAPVGADLLPADQRPPAVAPVAVNVSGLSLRAQDGNLLDAGELAPEPVADVSVPDLVLAEVGATLSDDDHLPLPLLEIELDDWEIADAGADLLLPDERPVVVPVVVGPVDFGLAPVGSDLGQLKPQVKLVNPDTSGLRLTDSV